MIYGHGDDLYLYGDKIKYNFSSNIIARDDHSLLMAELVRNPEEIGRYPEPEALSLEKKIAENLGIKSENVLVTNGATEAIYLLAHLKEGCHSFILKPSFREYQDACKLSNHKITFFERLEEIKDNPAMIWICNPNNPTGRIVSPLDIKAKAIEYRETLFVLDQAYAEYGIKKVITPQEAIELGNMVLLGSLTKRFSVPGLRIGFAVASKEIADSIRGMKMPWSVNSLAIKAGHYLLDNSDKYQIDNKKLNIGITRIQEALREIGIESYPSECNFALFKLPENVGRAMDLKNYLIENYGLLIRDASNFEGLDNSFFRVASQSEEENDLLIHAIKEFMKEPKLWRN